MKSQLMQVSAFSKIAKVTKNKMMKQTNWISRLWETIWIVPSATNLIIFNRIVGGKIQIRDLFLYLLENLEKLPNVSVTLDYKEIKEMLDFWTVELIHTRQITIMILLKVLLLIWKQASPLPMDQS